MTPTAAGTAPGAGQPGREALRWGTGFALVAALHAVLGWSVLRWVREPSPPAAPPPAAVMIDLAPLPAAPPTPRVETPPTPEPPRPVEPPPPEPPPPEPPPPEPPPPEPPPPEPPPPEPAPPMPEAAPSPAPEVAVPLPPKPKPKPKPVEHRPPPRPPPPEPAPAAAVPAPPSPLAAAPAPGAAPPAPSPNAVPSWQGRVMTRLAQFKRYPPAAQDRREEGVAYLRFTMDREGNVLSARVERGSGYDLLDEEAAALVRRAEPLPKPPPEVPGQRIELVVPIQFHLRDRR